jgi:preprotein translocase subunit SecA
MLAWIKKVFGLNYTEKEINKISVAVEEINQFFDKYEKLSDEQIKAKTEEFKKRVQKK